MHNTTPELWTFTDHDSWRGTDITGFKVQAIDGEIGAVDEATYDIGASFIVCDTGPWIFGKKVLLPAGVIERVDLDAVVATLEQPRPDARPGRL